MRRILMLFIAAFACWLAACAPEEIIAAATARSDAGAPGGGEPGEGARCRANAECGVGAFCEKKSCGDPEGRCQRQPSVCGDDADPVCGCDGLTYFNDCLRRALAVSIASTGECPREASPCGGMENRACPGEAYCARLLPGGMMCPRDAAGTCWILPAECDRGGGSDRWIPCAPPGGPLPPMCVGTCSAIRSGAPHTRALRCP